MTRVNVIDIQYLYKVHNFIKQQKETEEEEEKESGGREEERENRIIYKTQSCAFH